MNERAAAMRSHAPPSPANRTATRGRAPLPPITRRATEVARTPVWFPPGEDPGEGWAPSLGPDGQPHDQQEAADDSVDTQRDDSMWSSPLGGISDVGEDAERDKYGGPDSDADGLDYLDPVPPQGNKWPVEKNLLDGTDNIPGPVPDGSASGDGDTNYATIRDPEET